MSAIKWNFQLAEHCGPQANLINVVSTFKESMPLLVKHWIIDAIQMLAHLHISVISKILCRGIYFFQPVSPQIICASNDSAPFVINTAAADSIGFVAQKNRGTVKLHLLAVPIDFGCRFVFSNF